MSVVVITPPAPIVSLSLAKRHCKIDGDDEDELVQIYCQAAQGMIDGPGGWLGRCIGQQTLELRLDAFPQPIWGWSAGAGGLFWGSAPGDAGSRVGRGAGRIALPYPPLISVTSVIYEDQDGNDQTFPSADYLASDEGLAAAFGTSFPAGRWQANSVRIRYVAGYETIPGPIVSALLLMVSDLFANRVTAVTGVRAAAVSIPMSTTVEALLGPYRVFA